MKNLERILNGMLSMSTVSLKQEVRTTIVFKIPDGDTSKLEVQNLR